jgi:uncharacterized protein (DUF342 family)
MSAFADVGAGSPESAAVIDASLKAAGIVEGVDRTAYAVLAHALQGGDGLAKEVEIARGTPAGASRDGYFDPAFEPGLRPGHVRDDGSMDFRDRELLKPVSIGDELGRVSPPVAGTPGVRVDGAPAAAKPGKPSPVQVGEGAELLADGRVRATSAGVVIYVEGRSIGVGRHFVHEGDVDLRSGDLSMEGSLMVRSDVRRGFVARATGDLEIKGGVDGSAYAGANLKIFGGVRGGEGSVASAGGHLRVHHAERARLQSGGLIELVDAVNSEMSAVQIHIARSLRGGRAAVDVSLVTRDAGTAAATADTVIEAGVPRDDPEGDARNVLQTERARRLVARMPGPRGKTTDHGKSGKLTRELASGQKSVIARKIERAERMAALLPRAFIEVRGRAHAGVLVRIGNARLLLEEPMQRVRFTLDLENHTIRTEGLK